MEKITIILERKEVKGGIDFSKGMALQISHEFLKLTNSHTMMNPLLDEFVEKIKKYTDCGAVGIRLLDEEGNIPYQAYRGFPPEFYKLESPLSIRSDQCMCIYVIKNETDPSLPFFTEGGSFYMNGTTRFLSTISEAEKGQTRNVCNQFGYESVALVPIRLGTRILGLIQLADSHENKVPFEMVELLENVAMQLGTALQRIWAEDELKKSQEHLEDLVQERTAELRNAQVELKNYSANLEKMIERSEFYKDLLSHDVSNILQSISFSTEICLLSINEPEAFKNDLKEIQNQVDRAAKLVENVKNLSKLDETTPPLEPIEVMVVLKGAVKSVQKRCERQKVNIQMDFPNEELYIPANAFLLDVFENILLNGVTHNKNPVPEIFIRISRVQRNEINYLQLEFKDNGVGIPDAQKELVFQRTAGKGKRSSGLGLGLSIVKKIVSSYKGSVWVENRVPGDYSQGSKFVVQIPEESGNALDIAGR